MDNQVDGDEGLVKRSFWAALFLQIFALSGYLYLGRPWRAFLFWGIVLGWFFVIGLGLWGWLENPLFYPLLRFLAVAIFVLLVIDFVALADKSSPYDLKWYNKWFVYLFVVLVAVSTLFLTGAYKLSGLMPARLFSIPSSSMNPTLQKGDFIAVDMSAFNNNSPQRGDMIVFLLPSNQRVTYVKRVIGLPHDKVQLKKGVVFINGKPLNQVPMVNIGGFSNESGKVFPKKKFLEQQENGKSYTIVDMYQSELDNTQVFDVPEGHYFVLGDNRDNSSDSRIPNIVGMVSRNLIGGKVRGIVWSINMKRMGIKFPR